MVNPVAGSFSERVPILVISGGPGEEERKLGTLIHHQAKEIESQFRIYHELTCAARVIDDPRDRGRGRSTPWCAPMWREQRPGYLEIHRDMVERVIEVPRELDRTGTARLEFARSDPRKRARGGARDRPRAATPRDARSVIVGIETFRYKLTREVRAAGRAHRRAVHDHRAREGRVPDGSPAATWASTSARSARRRSASASTAPTWCSTSARC